MNSFNVHQTFFIPDFIITQYLLGTCHTKWSVES